jgi:hypothetical protein
LGFSGHGVDSLGCCDVASIGCFAWESIGINPSVLQPLKEPVS